jgi:hypothetical protein
MTSGACWQHAFNKTVTELRRQMFRHFKAEERSNLLSSLLNFVRSKCCNSRLNDFRAIFFASSEYSEAFGSPHPAF